MANENDLAQHMSNALNSAGVPQAVPGPDPAGGPNSYYPAYNKVVNSDSKNRAKGNSGDNLVLNYPWRSAK